MKKLFLFLILMGISVNAFAMAKKPKEDPCINKKWECGITAFQACAPIYRKFDPTIGMAGPDGKPVGGWTLDETEANYKECKTSKEQACFVAKGC